MAVRPEVVALLTDFDVEHTSSGQRFVHRDGRPFTAEETDLVVSATGEDMRAAARELAGAPERLAELFLPYIRAVAEKMSDGLAPTRRPE
jgi:hypothetical protein